MKILIVDGNVKRVEELRKKLLKNGQKRKNIYHALNLEKGWKQVEANKINAVFIDIELSEKFDFNLLRKYKLLNLNIIFLIDNSGLAKVPLIQHDLLFLTRPIDEELLTDILLSIQTSLMARHFIQGERENKKSNRIELKDKDGIRFVDIEKINHCSSDNNYTEIFLETGERLISTKTLKEHSSLLEPFGFFRVHQSHLVDLKRIRKIINRDGLFVGLENGTVVELSRRRKEQLLKKLRGLHD
jgi:two-component system LytT family response regulator